MRRAVALFVSAAALPLGCALVGYDFNDYRSSDGTGGASASAGSAGGSGSAVTGSSTSTSSSSGGPQVCGGMPFMPYASVTVAQPPVALHAARMDGDGKPDLVMASPTAGWVSVIFNTGATPGMFGNEQDSPPMGIMPAAITTGNLDAIARPDVVVADLTTKGVGLAFNSGNGTLGAFATTTVCGSAVSDVAVSDFDGDMHDDIAVVCEGDGVYLLRGHGDGSLDMSLKIGSVVDAVTMTVARDLNGDTLPDLVVGSPSGIVTVLLSGSTPYQQVPYSVITPQRAAVDDFDKDGKLDIVVSSLSNAGALLLNQGTGSFQNTQLAFGVPTQGIATADFDRDGNPDIAVAGDGVVLVRFGQGNGTFNPPMMIPGLPHGRPLEAVDVNGDGRIDLVEGSYGKASLGVFINNCP